LGVLVGVEGVHEDERHVDVEATVQVLDLAHGEIEEGHALTDLNDRLGTNATHGGTKTTVQLDNGELVQELDGGVGTDVIVANNLGRLGRGDLVPVDGVALGLVVQETAEQGEKVVHLSLEALLLVRVGDAVAEGVEGIAHL